jgi:hypothetical protein
MFMVLRLPKSDFFSASNSFQSYAQNIRKEGEKMQHFKGYNSRLLGYNL